MSKTKATQAEIRLHCVCLGLEIEDADYIFLHWSENGWTRGGKAIKDWRRCIEIWKLAGYFPSQRKRILEQRQNTPSKKDVTRVIHEYKDRMVGSRDDSGWDRICRRELGVSYQEAMKVLE